MGPASSRTHIMLSAQCEGRQGILFLLWMDCTTLLYAAHVHAGIFAEPAVTPAQQAACRLIGRGHQGSVLHCQVLGFHDAVLEREARLFFRLQSQTFIAGHIS